jgi:hypothetical protein
VRVEKGRSGWKEAVIKGVEKGEEEEKVIRKGWGRIKRKEEKEIRKRIRRRSGGVLGAKEGGGRRRRW